MGFVEGLAVIRRLVVVVSLVAFASVAPPAHAECSLAPTGGLVHHALPAVIGTTTLPVGFQSYELYVPEGLSRSTPLLVTFHGTGSSGASHADQTDWTQTADANGFVAAFPSSIARVWSFSENSVSVETARRIVQDIRSQYCIDDARIFASGHSSGAYFAQRLACDASDVFAAVTAFAGGSPGACTLERPVSVGLFHGDADRVVSPDWGRTSRDEWVARLGCDPEPDVSNDDGLVELYGGCDAGAEVLRREYAGQGHLWPTDGRSLDMRTRMWDFLMRHPMPAA